MRHVPDDLVEIGRELYKNGMGAAAIFRWMQHHLAKKGEQAEFNVRDVESAVGATTGEKRLDATNLVASLRQREVDQGLFYRAQTNDAAELTHVFMQAAGSHAVYANEIDQQVVEIDTKVRARRALCTWRHPHTLPRIHSMAPMPMA